MYFPKRISPLLIPLALASGTVADACGDADACPLTEFCTTATFTTPSTTITTCVPTPTCLTIYASGLLLRLLRGDEMSFDGFEVARLFGGLGGLFGG
ncbi:hypothetical protein BDV28DRAFT_149258 [Aspergillus coremiiformis]|uniref:Extracellular membrane protein CFEM domain-containing protein n=1 Tax=Aspergillus coremiiformis TaxID=138285 RepID=A0A5N6Z3I1_9EURO|nr:hypothetical protein BDV28DRAFT_149258 [Aspergillus coremiiformis]